MNKKQYLDALKKELLQSKVTDVDEVLADYEAHFARKAMDGHAEEEIARRLGNPREIAADFLPDAKAQGNAGAGKGRGLVRCALCASDLFALPFFALLFLWAAGMLAGSAGVFALGGYISLGMTFISAIPVLPLVGGILLGLSIVMLSVLLCVASLWFFMLSSQMTRAYLRWHGNRWNARHELPLPVTPQMTGKRLRNTRTIVIVALACLVVLFAAAFLVMSVQAGTPGFWHTWHWFDTV
jgi:hypothetical protein